MGLYAAAHKRMLYDISIKVYGKMYPGGVVKIDRQSMLQDVVDTGVAVADVSFGTVRFLSGVFHGSHLR